MKKESAYEYTLKITNLRETNEQSIIWAEEKQRWSFTDKKNLDK
jgi:hypothetical protein